MQRIEIKFNQIRKIGIAMVFFSFTLFMSTSKQVEAIMGGPTHIGTFEGRTTFTTGSSNGVNPGLYLQVMDRYGNYKEYTSEDGVLTIDGTKEGAYVTQAKLLGKTKYRDIHTGELLDQWEAGRDLRLESSKMPVLTTTGKNLYSYGDLTINNPMTDKWYYTNGKTSSFGSSCKRTDGGNWFYLEKGVYSYKSINENVLTNIVLIGEGETPYGSGKEIPSGWYVFRFKTKPESVDYAKISQIQLEKGPNITTYEPFKSNILTVNEPVELRGIGEVKDELNLLTGEVTQRIGEMILDGTEGWAIATTNYSDGYIYQFNYQEKFGSKVGGQGVISDKFKNGMPWADGTGEVIQFNSYLTHLQIKHSTITSTYEFTQWLANNPMLIFYQPSTESIKTVDLTSDYYFQPVMNRDVHIDGTILPLVCSVTIPTEHLSFVLNPNEEKGKQFVAPDFSITNNTPASIYLELNTFEQLANDLNDVLPTEHENWNTLDRKQSKDIALALVPKPSDGWLSLTEGPRYVADSSNYYLGEVKAESSVDFTFEANHGRAFLETLSPRYRLSFIFDFFDK